MNNLFILKYPIIFVRNKLVSVMGKVKDRSGQKFNKWTILEYVENDKYGNARWLCQCECGNKHILTVQNVVNGSSRQCLDCSFIRNYKKGELPTPVWKTIKSNSLHRGRALNITKDFAEKLFVKQNKKCALSGLDINFAKSNKEYTQGLQTASLDRIDSNKEYTKDNVQWVHKNVNLMKNRLDEKYFIELCKKIVENAKNKIKQ